MKNEFVKTDNSITFDDICTELADPMSRVGPSLAMVTGPAGRGKSEAAKRYATQTEAIYILPMNIRSPAQVLREIAFEVASMKPTRSWACLDIISEEMARARRLVMIDEADLLSMQVLEMLRNVNECYGCPVLLIGEDELKSRVASRRRIASRVRRKMEFGPVSASDVGLFFRQNLDQKITPEVATAIRQHSNGDWRPVLTLALTIERSMKSSGASEITYEMVRNAIGHS